MENSEKVYSLRNLKIEDKVSMAKHANNKKIADMLRDGFPHPYTQNDAENFINFVLTNNEPQTQFAIDINGEAVGMIGILLKDDIYKKNAEIGYWLSEDYWGKGIMTDILKAVIEYAFKTFDVIRLYASVKSANIGSMKVLEKCGFKKEGVFVKSIFKNGQFFDEHIYSLLRE